MSLAITQLPSQPPPWPYVRPEAYGPEALSETFASADQVREQFELVLVALRQGDSGLAKYHARRCAQLAGSGREEGTDVGFELVLTRARALIAAQSKLDSDSSAGSIRFEPGKSASHPGLAFPRHVQRSAVSLLPTEAPVTAARVQHELLRLSEERLSRLRILVESGVSHLVPHAPALTEDLSARPRTMITSIPGEGELVSKFGSPHLVAEAVRHGVRAGFQVVVQGQRNRGWQELLAELRPGERKNVRFRELPVGPPEVTGLQSVTRVEAFMEDGFDLHTDGSIGFPPVMADEILYDLPGEATVASRNDAWNAVAYGLTTGRPMHMDLGYTEKGNVVHGVLPSGESYALFGRDAVDASRMLLQREASALYGRKITFTDKQVIAVLAYDHGLSPENTVVLPQMAFHLDLSLATWTPGVVILNDAMAAASIQQKIFESEQKPEFNAPSAAADVDALWRYARAQDALEREAAQLLESRDFKVIRVAASATHHVQPYKDANAREVAATMFNGEGGTDVRGHAYYMTMNAPTALAIEFMRRVNEATGVQIQFILQDRKESMEGLWQGEGGLGCRFKVESFRARD